jgi:beta-lactamase class A
MAPEPRLDAAKPELPRGASDRPVPTPDGGSSRPVGVVAVQRDEPSAPTVPAADRPVALDQPVQASAAVGHLGPARAVAQQPARALEAQDATLALAAPGNAAPLVTAPPLAALVEHHLGDQRGIFGVAIKALEGGQGVLVNADRAFPAASLFKLPVMYEVYRQRDAGQLTLAERLILTWRYAELDLGTLDVPIGTALSVEAALRRMIAISDNASANMLADRVGWLSLNATVRDLGLQETRLTSSALTTSPRDMLLLLELLARGEGPTAASSADMIELLLEQRVNDRLPARLPPGIAVAHKTGNLDGIIHDVGIVYAPGAPFVIALLAEEAPYYGQVAQAQAALTRAVYDYFVTASGRLPPPPELDPDVTPTPTPPPTALPRPTARVWGSPVSLPPPGPTARTWQSPTPTATTVPRGP